MSRTTDLWSATTNVTTAGDPLIFAHLRNYRLPRYCTILNQQSFRLEHKHSCARASDAATTRQATRSHSFFPPVILSSKVAFWSDAHCHPTANKYSRGLAGARQPTTVTTVPLGRSALRLRLWCSVHISSVVPIF